MNQRLRSRLLAASIVSTTLLGSGWIYSERAAIAQDLPSAGSLLDRGATLLDQKNYAEAKRILAGIDPAQLPEDQRARRTALLDQADKGLAATMAPGDVSAAAKADVDAGRLVAATAKYQAILANPAADAAVKSNAAVQLASIKQSQADLKPKMMALLDQAQALYDQNKLDDAQNALNTVVATGSDLGWENNNRIPQLQSRLNDRRTAMSRGPVAPGSGVPVVAPGAVAAPVAGPQPNPMDVTSAAPALAAGAPMDNGSLIDRVVSANDRDKERVEVLYNQAWQASRDALAKSLFPLAQAHAQEALDLIDQNPALFSDMEAGTLRDKAQVQLDLVKSQWEQNQRDQASEMARRANVDEGNRQRTAQEIRHQKVAALVADATKLYNATQFKEAADLLRQATIIDPQDQNAALLLRMVLDKIVDRQYDDILHRTGQEVERQQIDTTEHLIPYADLMVYPDNWPEITRKRVSGNSAQESPANRAVRDKLDGNLKSISAKGEAFSKVIEFLQNNLGANIIVNYTALAALTPPIDRQTPVSIDPPLTNVPYSKVLTLVLQNVGGNSSSLAYTIDDGIITISTTADLQSSKYQLVKVFDIRDMLVQPNANQQAPRINLNNIGGSGGASTGSGGGGLGGGGGFGGGGGQGGGFGGGGQGGQGGLFTDTSSQQTQNPQASAQQKQQAVENLVNTIQATVAPDTWRDSATAIQGAFGSIRQLNGQLIINQTVDNQIQIYNLLQQLRESLSVQIAVEARLLLVANNFLDDFRVGWNLNMPAGMIGGNVGAFSLGNLNTYQQATPQNTGVPGSIASFSTLPSLNLSASIIDNWTLSLLLTATQADRRTITVTAPRVTLFNGQNGYIAVTNQQNIVTSFNQTAASGGINGNSAVATNLNVSTLSTGVVLSVTATVSADRRYVVMTIDPQLATLDGIDTFVISTGTGNNTTTNNNSSNNNSSNANATNTSTALSGNFIQLPKVASTEVNTMVSIPDGGTLLIGGQKLIGEAEVEVGVPILSKIPGLNRLFTNRSYVKDERTLLVLVRPNIIIHSEIENDLFGVGYDRPTGLPGNTGESATPSIIPGVATPSAR